MKQGSYRQKDSIISEPKNIAKDNSLIEALNMQKLKRKDDKTVYIEKNNEEELEDENASRYGNLIDMLSMQNIKLTEEQIRH